MTVWGDAVRLLAFPVLATAALQDWRTNMVRRRLWYIIAAVAIAALIVDIGVVGAPVVLITQALSGALVTGLIGGVMVLAGAGKADGIGLAVVGLWWPHTIGGLVLGALAGLLALCTGVVLSVIVRSTAIEVTPAGEPGDAIPFISVLAPSVGLAVAAYLLPQLI